MKQLIKHIAVITLSAAMVFSMSGFAFAEVDADILREVSLDPSAYELIDTDGDGAPDTVRYLDGYEEDLTKHTVYRYHPDTHSTTAHIDYYFIDKTAETAKKHPGELQSAKDYKAKNESLALEYNALKSKMEQDILTDVLNSQSTVEARVNYLYSGQPIDSRIRNVDNSASTLIRYQQIDPDDFYRVYYEHYYEYTTAKKGYESYLEDIAFFKGERPVNESDYNRIKETLTAAVFDKIVHDPNDTQFCDTSLVSNQGKSLRLLRISGEWYEMYYFDGKFTNMTKGYSDNATQMIIEIGKSNTYNTLGLLFDDLPEDAQQKILDAGLTVHR